MVTDIGKGVVTLKRGEAEETINARTVLWAAGMKASTMGRVLADRAGAELDRAGRVIVKPDLTVPNQPNILVIGDLAHFAHQGDKPLPGVAPVAMQQGEYAATLIRDRLAGETSHLPFHYFDKGSLAVIGRHAAVASVGPLKISGILAWLAWAFIHIWYLIGFGNKAMVMFQWAWNYLTWQRSARLITGKDPFPLVESSPPSAS
jgi:NADH dehydrogenase